MIYLAGSLRNPEIPRIHAELAELTKLPVFSDWYAAGPEADDYWKAYYQGRGYTYSEALKEPASVNVFNFDKKHIDLSSVMVLAYPAGKSAHLELGYHIGRGKPGFILLDEVDRWDVMLQFCSGVTSDIKVLANMVLAEARCEQRVVHRPSRPLQAELNTEDHGLFAAIGLEHYYNGHEEREPNE